MDTNFTVLSEALADKIRAEYMSRYVLSYDDMLAKLKRKHPEWLNQYGYTMEMYSQHFLWDKAVDAFEDIDFHGALQALRHMNSKVYFMSEKPERSRPAERLWRNCFVATGDATLLADKIEYDWFEEHRLFEQRMCLMNAFPTDLYVFDENFSQVIIFTHETDETELPESRYCMIKRTDH